jgi:cysteine synthase
VVNLREHLDFHALGVTSQVAAYALVGGIYPSGSIKDVGLLRVLQSALDEGRYRRGQALAELSNGSMARSVSWLAGEIGVDCFVAFPGSSSELVKDICGRFSTRHLEVGSLPREAGHPLVQYFEAFDKSSRELDLFYFDQTRNPAFRTAYSTLARPVLREMTERHGAPKVSRLIGSVGTGSTLLGLAEGLARLGASRPYVVGVEPALMPDSASVPWEDIPGLRNTRAFHWNEFGKTDAYGAHFVNQRCEVTKNQAAHFAASLEQGGLRGSLSAGATLAGFLEAAKDQEDETSLLILSDVQLSA